MQIFRIYVLVRWAVCGFFGGRRWLFHMTPMLMCVHVHPTPYGGALHRPAGGSLVLPAVEVRRDGRFEPFLDAHPTLSSAGAKWSGLALEDYSVPALVIPTHEHVENFVHVVLRGSVKYRVRTRGKTSEYQANPGTTFILPQGTVDEVTWRGPTRRLAVAIHPRLLVSALGEATHERDIELTEHWNLMDPRSWPCCSR